MTEEELIIKKKEDYNELKEKIFVSLVEFFGKYPAPGSVLFPQTGRRVSGIMKDLLNELELYHSVPKLTDD